MIQKLINKFVRIQIGETKYTEAHRHIRLQNPERRRAEQECDAIGKSIYFNTF